MLKSSVLILMMLQMENNSLRIIDKLRLSIEFRTCLIYLKWSLGFSTPTVPPLWFGAKMLPDFGGVTSLSFSSAISHDYWRCQHDSHTAERNRLKYWQTNRMIQCGTFQVGGKIPTVKTFEQRPAKEIFRSSEDAGNFCILMQSNWRSSHTSQFSLKMFSFRMITVLLMDKIRRVSPVHCN